jgi:predicted nucleic acid-binding protein
VIYVDTGAFLARYLSRDQYHQKAGTFWEKIRKNQESCFTSNFVLDETFTLLGRWAGYNFSSVKAASIYASKLLNILRPTRDDEIKAIEFFRKSADQNVSFTDCISIVLMRNKNIKRVFSFDSHFERAGFKLCP